MRHLVSGALKVSATLYYIFKLESVLEHEMVVVVALHSAAAIDRKRMGACSCVRGEEIDIFSTALSPNQPADFYIQRADAYFNLISGNDAEGNPLQDDFVKPEYSKFMVLWEWEPWLLLTGKNNGWSEEWELIDSTQAVSIPHVVKNRVYRFSTTSLFVRAMVDFQ